METYCRDATDPSKQTGGPDFVTESCRPSQFGPGPVGSQDPLTRTWGPIPGDLDPGPGTHTQGPGHRDAGTRTWARGSGPGPRDPGPRPGLHSQLHIWTRCAHFPGHLRCYPQASKDQILWEVLGKMIFRQLLKTPAADHRRPSSNWTQAGGGECIIECMV